MAFWHRSRAVRPVEIDDDGSLVTLAGAYDVAAGDGAAVALVPEGTPVLVRQVFAGVGTEHLEEIAAMGAEEGWGGLTHDGDRAVLRSTRTLTPLSASQQRARMTGIAHRLHLTYLGWEAAAPPPSDPPPMPTGRRRR